MYEGMDCSWSRKSVSRLQVCYLTSSSSLLKVSFRAPIDPTQLQRFTFQEDQPPPARPLLKNGEPVPISRREIQYNMICESELPSDPGQH